MNSAVRAPNEECAEAPKASDELTYATPPDELHEGDIVGRFRIGGIIGAGGHGVVYAASHVELGYPVALKVLDRDAGRDPRRRARFRHEAMVGARARHRNVVAILETGTLDSGAPYLVMEHVRGVELASLLDRHGPLTPAAAIDLGLQLLAALSALAEHDIVHRDIKPQNLMLARTADGAVELKLLDFGIVKALGPTGARGLTKEGFVLGTPQYMSPEQIRGQPLDPRSDLWAVAVLLYEALAGAPPFDAAQSEDVLHAVLIQSPRPIVGCPAPLEQVLWRALSKRREERYPSPKAMQEALLEVRRLLHAPQGAAAWERLLPELDRARAAAPPLRDPTMKNVSERVARLASPDASRRLLPTPPERPSALRLHRARPRLPPPWWPAVALVAVVILVFWAISSPDVKSTPARSVELASPSAAP